MVIYLQKLYNFKKIKIHPAPPVDLNLPTISRGVSSELIVDGEILYQNLEQLNLSVQWLHEELTKKGISHHREVVYASLDTKGNLYIDKFDDNLSSLLTSVTIRALTEETTDEYNWDNAVHSSC